MTFGDLLPETAASLRTAVFTALGEASMCWETIEGAGVFQSEQAADVGERLVQKIVELLDPERPSLGLATSRELIVELGARIDLDYRTVDA